MSDHPIIPRASVLDEARQALLVAVLNQLIPARDDLPGAGDLGAGRVLEQALAGDVALRRLILDGLAQIDVAAARLAGRPFVALAPEQQEAGLRAVENAQPLFFAALVDYAYRGYYTLPRVYAAIGYASRPPQPQGYQLPAFDPALLARQRERAPFWRRTT